MNIIEMAKQAGFKERHGIIRTMHSSGAWVGINEEVEAFAQLVRAEVLEEAAEYFQDGWASPDCYEIADAIRALKGEAK
jgi:hypothetical protein